METVNISVSVLLLLVLVPVVLFIVYVLVMSIWDNAAAFVRGLELGERKRAKVAGASEAELNGVLEAYYAAKVTRRKVEEQGWEREFVDSLGSDRAEFVAQWSAESPRKVLAKKLGLLEELAEKEGRWEDVGMLGRMRDRLTESPATPLDLEEIERMAEYLERLARERQAVEVARMETAAWRL